MIEKVALQELIIKVRQAVSNLISQIEVCATQDNFLPLLARIEFIPKSQEEPDKGTWVTGYAKDQFQEKDIGRFLVDYLNRAYLPNSPKTEDSNHDLILEMMLYTQIWESTSFLKVLYRLAKVISGKAYPGTVNIPDFQRFPFFRDEIRKEFENSHQGFFELLRDAYKSQYRNAFAHNDFSLVSNHIVFHNYNPAKHHPVERLGYNDWTRVFLISAILWQEVNRQLYKKSIDFTNGQEFEVTLRRKEVNTKVKLKYSKEQEQFYGKDID